VAHTLTDAQVEALAAAAHGFVGADLAALVAEAALVALR
jgi:SpoVK/Ycf46/Vps4 family AAA+-type ATPase